jgi:MoxR-like ATPase
MDTREKLRTVLDEAKKFIYGQDELLDAILAALVCDGHVLIEGLPGLGKTMSVATIAKLCDLDFKRVQFTPDLLPSDLIGTMIYSQKNEQFSTKFGPIFTQLLLADEINRSPAKVQAALLEAMAEKQVTIGDETHRLASPFVVLATQNPIEQEGTYPLPEAQLDRFMMKVTVDYPDFEAEKKILGLKSQGNGDMGSFIGTDDILRAKKEADEIYLDEKIKDLIVRIVQGTRPGSIHFPKKFKDIISCGCSPRATIWLFKLSKYYSYLEQKEFVTPEHVLKIVPLVLGHRLALNYEAIVDGHKSREVALQLARELI